MINSQKITTLPIVIAAALRLRGRAHGFGPQRHQPVFLCRHLAQCPRDLAEPATELD